MNVLESIHFITYAWELITQSGIANCFQRTGFMEGKSTEEYELDIEAEISDRESMEYVDDYIRLQSRMNFITSFEDYVSVDVEVLPREMLSADDICGATESKEEIGENDEESSL